MAISTVESRSLKVQRSMGTDPDTGKIIQTSRSYSDVSTDAQDEAILDVYDIITGLQDGTKSGCRVVQTNLLERE